MQRCASLVNLNYRWQSLNSQGEAFTQILLRVQLSAFPHFWQLEEGSFRKEGPEIDNQLNDEVWLHQKEQSLGSSVDTACNVNVL